MLHIFAIMRFFNSQPIHPVHILLAAIWIYFFTVN